VIPRDLPLDRLALADDPRPLPRRLAEPRGGQTPVPRSRRALCQNGRSLAVAAAALFPAVAAAYT